MLIGVISDTHGLLRPEALAALAGVDHILHAGDVGDVAILDSLREIAPVTAIRGNVDTHGPCAELPATEAVTPSTISTSSRRQRESPPSSQATRTSPAPRLATAFST